MVSMGKWNKKEMKYSFGDELNAKKNKKLQLLHYFLKLVLQLDPFPLVGCCFTFGSRLVLFFWFVLVVT
jgi:hypothetical protein